MSDSDDVAQRFCMLRLPPILDVDVLVDGMGIEGGEASDKSAKFSVDSGG
jgi:hypothetical protein